MLYRLRKDMPEKEFYPASATAVCPNMKMNTLEMVRDSLEENRFVVTVPEATRKKAYDSIARMLEL